MKITALILSFVIFTLAVTPCSDGQTCAEEDVIEMAGTHDHSEDEHDACTPFCTCQCCGISVTFSTVQPISFKQELQAYLYSFNYLHANSRDYLDRIWIPPSV